ncbi:MAG: hypothetical protein WBB85_00735 [Albidovulum sp.]|uniref:hypothetical protein n=1 Tax=Albidovulum sp. TaxID=1872424 RepID=UPI003CA127C5
MCAVAPISTSNPMLFGVLKHAHPSEPAPGKHVWMDENGVLRKETAGRLTRSNYFLCGAADLTGFADRYLSLPASVHLTAGIASGVSEALVLPSHAAGNGVIARTNEYFRHPAGNALLTIDCDQIGDPDAVREELLNALPGLTRAAMATASSSSSNLSWPGGETGAKSLHCFLMVADGSDVPRALEDAHKRLVLSGAGRHKVATDGSFLERSIVDLQLRVPSQPIFLRAHVCDPVMQTKDVRLYDGLAPVDSRVAIPPLSEIEEARLRSMLLEARSHLAPEMARARSLYTGKRVQEMVGTWRAAGPRPDANKSDAEHARSWPFDADSSVERCCSDCCGHFCQSSGIPPPDLP